MVTGFGAGVPCFAADSGTPSELVQYVADARHAGVNDGQIRKDAITAGWPAAVVDETIAKVNEKAQPATTEVAGNTAIPPASATPIATQPAPQKAENSAPTPAAPPLEENKNRGVPDDYKIGSGDVLQISVWKEPDASVPSVVVRPDGRITLPLIKEVNVAGLSPHDVETAIADRLASFINGVDVTVIVTKIESKKLYVLGAVKKEGIIPYTYRMNVIQALSEAGGLTDYAKRRNIYVLRNENGKDYRLQFDYEKVIKGEKMEQNIQLLPGDTIFVPQ
jgi:polysaccharide export outer membrane protein